MITLLNQAHAVTLFRTLRKKRRLTQQQIATRLHVTQIVVSLRERHLRGMHTDALIDTARVFGFDVALIPARRPHARPTGTGWPT